MIDPSSGEGLSRRAGPSDVTGTFKKGGHRLRDETIVNDVLQNPSGTIVHFFVASEKTTPVQVRADLEQTCVHAPWFRVPAKTFHRIGNAGTREGEDAFIPGMPESDTVEIRHVEPPRYFIKRGRLSQ
jgi:hypothetical protein